MRGKPLTLRAHDVCPNVSSAFLCAERLFAANSEEGVRSSAYGQLMKNLLQAIEQARAQQNLLIIRVNFDT